MGFESAGFKHVGLIDNDPHSCATLRMNRPYWNVIEADLRRFRADYWYGVDVVAAGLPCPPFSVAGKQLGANDERDLFPVLLGVVAAAEPRAVLVENVRGLMAPRFAGYRSQICSLLEQKGYTVYWDLLDAYYYGASQHRTRAFRWLRLLLTNTKTSPDIGSRFIPLFTSAHRPSKLFRMSAGGP